MLMLMLMLVLMLMLTLMHVMPAWINLPFSSPSSRIDPATLPISATPSMSRLCHRKKDQIVPAVLGSGT
jgi:hypothetical protein